MSITGHTVDVRLPTEKDDIGLWEIKRVEFSEKKVLTLDLEYQRSPNGDGS